MSPPAALCVSSKSELRGVSASFAATCPLQSAKKTERVSAKLRALRLVRLLINYNSRFLVCDERERSDKLRLGTRTSLCATTDGNADVLVRICHRYKNHCAHV